MWKNWKIIVLAAGVGLVLYGLAALGGYILGRRTLAGDLEAAEHAAKEFRVVAANAARDRENARFKFQELSGRIDSLGSGIIGVYERAGKRRDESRNRLGTGRSIAERLQGYADDAQRDADDAELIERLIRESGLFGD